MATFTKRQTRAFFLGSTGLFSLIFVGLTIDAHRQFPKLKHSDQITADVIAGKHVHSSVRAMVVPGSTSVKRAAEDDGLDAVFNAAGFEWRNAGCSMCLGMNPDILAPGERCASTSNRNFEGRQGSGGRTHLMSPPMAAAAAITGHVVDVRELLGWRRFRRSPAEWRRSTAPTWTPTRSSPSNF